MRRRRLTQQTVMMTIVAIMMKRLTTTGITIAYHEKLELELEAQILVHGDIELSTLE